MVGERAARAGRAGDVLVAEPAAGRVHRSERRVRVGDVGPSGRLRLDAIATVLQDAATDDARDAGLRPDHVWVVRRTVVEVMVQPGLSEVLTIATWCSALGPRWAERRFSLSGSRGGRVEAAMLWVAIDQATGRPVRLDPRFVDAFGPAAGNRTVTARLALGPVGEAASRVPWELRATDLDVLGHVNNAVSWAMLEQVAATLAGPGDPLDAPGVRVELEHPREIAADARVELRGQVARDGDSRRLDLWATLADDASSPCTAARAWLPTAAAVGQRGSR